MMTIPDEKEYMNKEAQYPKDKDLIFHKLYGGLHWRFLNKNGDNLSVILHDGSYGSDVGLFEIMPSWQDKDNKKWSDSVKGYCTFGEVQKWIDKLRLRESVSKRKE